MQAIAAIPGETQPQLVELVDPADPGPGEVRCATVALGICGTDRDILESTRPLVPPGAPFLVLGHECVARVEAVGPGVTQVQEGDLVVPVVRRALDRHAVRADMLPFGTFTERGIVREHGFSAPRWLDRPEYLFPVPEGLGQLAVLTEPLSVAEKGVNEALAVQRGRCGADTWSSVPPRVLVTGMGPIGFAGILACIARRWPVTLFGRDPADSWRADLARRLGADYRSAPHWCQAPGDVEADGFDLILECTGSDEALLRAAVWLAARGVMVWLGSSRRPQPRMHNLDELMRNAVLRNHVHLGTVNAAPRDFSDAIRHLSQLQPTRAREIASLITARVSLPDSLWHYHHRQPQGIKVVVEMGG